MRFDVRHVAALALAGGLLAGCAAPPASPSPPAISHRQEVGETSVPSAVPTETATASPSATPTATATATATPTATAAPTETSTSTPTPTAAPPATRIPTATAASPVAAPTRPSPTPVAPSPVPVAPTATSPGVAPLASGALTVPAGVLQLSGRERALYAQAAARGRDPAMFTVAGDSNSAWVGYLGQIATGSYPLSGRPREAAIAARFAPAFWRQSVAVEGGLRAADMFAPNWPGKPATCLAEEGRYPCELRLSRASIVFIQIGTGDRYVWTEYEANLRRMLDLALSQGVLPVLVTKADDLENWQGGAPMGYLNDVVRRLAAAYQLPLIDFWASTRGLPVIPNPQLPDRPFTQNGLLDEWGYYFHLSDLGKEMRILTTLDMLALIAG